MNAAVIELNPLADTVGSAAEYDDFSSAGRVRLAFSFKSRIKIRRGRLKFGAAGVNNLVNGIYAEGLKVFSQLLLFYA